MDNMVSLSQEELYAIDGGSFWKYVGAAGTIAFGAYEIYTGVGAVDGTRRIVTGVCMIGGEIYAAIN